MDHMQVAQMAENYARLSMTAKAAFGGDITHEIRPTEVKRHGFNCDSGGWALQSGDSPAYFLIYKRKARRKPSTINVKNIVALNPVAKNGGAA